MLACMLVTLVRLVICDCELEFGLKMLISVRLYMQIKKNCDFDCLCQKKKNIYIYICSFKIGLIKLCVYSC